MQITTKPLVICINVIEVYANKCEIGDIYANNHQVISIYVNIISISVNNCNTLVFMQITFKSVIYYFKLLDIQKLTSQLRKAFWLIWQQVL